MKLSKLLLATVGATVLLGTLVSSAPARFFSLSNQNISAMWTSIEFALAGTTTRCQLTLEGSFHSRAFAKTIGSLIGHITRATLGPCSNGTATILQEALPWHLRYSGFEGALPAIRSIIFHVIGASFRVREPGGIACHLVTTAAQPGQLRFTRNTVTTEIPEAWFSGRIRTTGAECLGLEATLSTGVGPVSLLGTSAVKVSLTLI